MEQTETGYDYIRDGYHGPITPTFVNLFMDVY